MGDDGGDLDAPLDATLLDGGTPADALARPDADDAAIPTGIAEEFYAFCVRRWTAFCQGNQSCCEIVIRPYLLDPNNCAPTEIAAVCRRAADAERALHDGTLRWDEAAAEAYLAQMEARAPECSRGPGIASLRSFLIGTMGLGGDCTPDDVYRFPSVFRCENGLRCELTGTATDYTGRCAPLAVEGESCTQHVECVERLYCEWRDAASSDPFRGRCRSLLPLGAPCPSDAACESGFCTIAATCEERSDTNTWCQTTW